MDVPASAKSFLKFFLLLVIILVFIFLGTLVKFDMQALRDYLGEYPLWISGGIFILLYVAATTLLWLGPKDVLRIASALVFGPYVSTVLVWIGELGNAYVLFHISRRLGRKFVEEKFRLKTQSLENVRKDSSALGIIALRSNPLIPYRLMDLGFGLSSISFRKYFRAIFIISLPRIFWLQFIIAAVGEGIFKGPVYIIRYLQDHPVTMRWSLIYFFFVAALSLTAIIKKFFRKKTFIF